MSVSELVEVLNAEPCIMFYSVVPSDLLVNVITPRESQVFPRENKGKYLHVSGHSGQANASETDCKTSRCSSPRLGNSLSTEGIDKSKDETLTKGET